MSVRDSGRRDRGQRLLAGACHAEGKHVRRQDAIVVSHTTIHRWVIRYVPEFEKRWNRFARPGNNSWRVDEAYVKVRGK